MSFLLICGESKNLVNLLNRHLTEPSNINDKSERAPILYGSIGRIEDVFPELRVRAYIANTFHSIHLNLIFADEYSVKGVSEDYDLRGIEFLK